ncbi:MAG: T9SS type A sorting domain-containing protein, partial [Ignavibacteria bacterium]|nr:T9SS type A sorting domain-containing protein [Ignavibacteria bacterium]
NKVCKTTDSGVSWVIYSQPGSNRSVGFFDSENGILGTLDSARPLSRSTNGGLNWTIVTEFSPVKPNGVCGISIVNENTAYIAGTYYNNARVYRTIDKGVSWSLVFNDTSLARTLVDCHFWSADSGIIAGGYNISTVYDGNAVILITSNGGNSWERIYKSSRNKEWCWKVSFNKSYSNTFGVASIERFPANGLSYILKTTNQGFNWSEIPFKSYDQEGIGFVNENTGWVGGYGSGFQNDSNYMTTNGGLNWSNAGWGRSMNRIRFINDTLAFASGSYAYKYSRNIVGISYQQTEIPDQFNLYQNYPNPFNPITLVKYDIKSTGNNILTKTKLTVYDVTGKLVRELVNENLPPGKYQASFDAGYFSSGMYIYKLEAGDYSVSKKMLLLK